MPRSASAGGTARRLVTAIAWVVAAVGIAAAEPGPAGSLADRLKAVQSGDADSGVRLPTWKPVGPGTTNPPLPMAAGLVVVTAINQPPLGDYESIKTLVGVQGATVLMHYSANRPKPKLTGALKVPTDLALGNADPSLEFPDKVECARQIDAADLDLRIGKALETLSVKEAAAVVSAETGQPRRKVYARAIELSARAR